MTLSFLGVAVPRRLTGLCLLIAAILSPGSHGLSALDDAWELLTSDE